MLEVRCAFCSMAHAGFIVANDLRLMCCSCIQFADQARVSLDDLARLFDLFADFDPAALD